jgi:hypothetical protein
MQQPTTVRKPEGGFIFISVRQLCRAWVAYQQRLIGIVDLWVWFAAHELVARRCQVQRGQPVHYRVEELTDLVSGTHSMASSLRKLARANLLHWHETKLTFPDDRSTLSDSAAVRAMLEQITNHHRLIPVPRRLIRYLAGGCHRVMVATIMGHLLRCLYYRDGGCRPQGHCKATWIAQVFGVSVRQVKQSRKMLESIGVLQRNSTPQWVLNRYGQTMTVNLQWHEPALEATLQAKATEDYLKAVTKVKSEVSIAVETDPVPETLSKAIYTTDTSAEDHLTPISEDLREVEARSAPQPVQELHTPTPSPTHFTPTSAPTSDPLTEIVAPLLAVRKTAPQLPTNRPPLAPPLFNSELSTSENHQKPADGPASGVLTTMFLAIRSALREGRLSPMEENPVVMRTVSTHSHHEATAAPSFSTLTKGGEGKGQKGEEQTPLLPPTLRNISLHDLRNTQRLLELYAQAVKAGLIGSSEADRLAFVALAQHVVAYRPDNAGGLFTQLLRKRHFDYITQDDEDLALRRLKRHFQDVPPPVLQPVVETLLRKTG